MEWRKFFQAVRSVWVPVDSMTCVNVGMDVRESFLVTVGLRQGYMMSAWLLNVYLECVHGTRCGCWLRCLGKGCNCFMRMVACLR